MRTKNISVFIALLFFAAPAFTFAQYNAQTVPPVKQKTEHAYPVKQQKPVHIQRDSDEPQTRGTKNIQSRVKDTAASLKGKLFKQRTVKDVAGNETTTDDKNKNIVKQRNAAENAQIAREKRNEEIAQKRVEQQKQLAEKRKERIRAYFTRMFTRLEAAVERLNKLMARVESRIQKFEERGVDVTDAQEKLQKARSAITEADFKLNAARGLVEDILSGEDPKKIFENARETVKSTVISIKQAHRALVDSIVALKGIASLDATEEDE